MRAGILLGFVLLPACAANVASGPPEFDSVHERLAHEPTRLFIAAPDSAGSVTAERRLSSGWQTGLVDLRIDNGELVLSATAAGTIIVERFGVGLQPIDLPADVVANGQLTHVRAELVAPVTIDAHWSDDDTATASATLTLDLSWTLSINCNGIPLGTPRLPPVPVELSLTGNGVAIHGELRAHAGGEIWSWADLVKLEDLSLVLDGATP
jgi:hypothetical protein